jgi:hypothetical protein
MDFSLAIKLMLYGLIGVFTVLIAFYVVIRLLPVAFPERDEATGADKP